MKKETGKKLSKKTGKKKKGYGFSTLDIETGKAGNVLQIRIYNEWDGFTSFATWLEFYHFLELNNTEVYYRNFIAHNGGKFDYISMLYEMLPLTSKSEVIMSNSLIICCAINDFKKRISFQDSMQVLKGSLKSLCKTFDIETPKTDIEIEKIEWIFNHNRKQFDYYLDCDCISLYQVCKKFMQLMNVRKFPYTIASFSLKQFLNKFQDETLDTNHINTQNAELKEHENYKFYSESYGGGRVEVFHPGTHKNIYSYDINSLYPYMMFKYDFPLPPRIVIGKYFEHEMGIFPVTFSQTDKSIPPFFWSKSVNGMEFLYEGAGVFTSVEIKEAKKYGIQMSIGDGIRFLNKGKIFKKFVKHFYNLRLCNMENALNLICKLVLNSLYGKFAEKGTGTIFKQLTDIERNELISDGVGVSLYSERFNLYEVDSFRTIKHSHKYLSAFVTAYARCYMFKYLNMYKNSICYMDTDSIHMTEKMNSKFIGSDLGLFKLEYEGQGTYIGRKQYIINKKARFKGVRTTGSLFHEDINEYDFKEMLEGKTIEKSFDTFPAFKTVLKKGGACKLTRVLKKLKKAEFMSNFNRKN